MAAQRKILVNVADTPDLCDFYLGSIVQKGSLKIAISTNGKSPTAAKRIKEVLHDALPGELDEVIDNLQKVRNRLNGNFEAKVKKLNSITKVLVEKDTTDSARRWRKIATFSLLIFASGELESNECSFSSPTFPAPTSNVFSCSSFKKTGYN